MGEYIPKEILSPLKKSIRTMKSTIFRSSDFPKIDHNSKNTKFWNVILKQQIAKANK